MPSLDPTTNTLSARLENWLPAAVLLTSAGVPRMPSEAMKGLGQRGEPEAALTACTLPSSEDTKIKSCPLASAAKRASAQIQPLVEYIQRGVAFRPPLTGTA